MPYPLPLTRTEAYLAYKAGVIQQSDLKPSLVIPRNGIDAWLAYWTGLAADYPKREDGTPHILQEEEAYIAYLCGVINEYPEKCLRRVGAYLRYLISARWGRPDHPLNREELYLSLLKTQVIPSGDPSSDITIDGTCKAPFVDVKMYGDIFQHRYTGKNLCDYTAATYPYSGNGITAELNDDGSIMVTGLPTKDYIIIVVQDITDIIEDGAVYTISCDNYGAEFYLDIVGVKTGGGLGYLANTRNGSASFTVDKTTFESYQVRIETYTRASWGGESKTVTRKFQLEKGSTATSWEKYVGGVPSPNPSYPQPIQTVTGLQTVEVAGKNMLNIDGFAVAGSYVGLTVQLVNKDESTGTIGLKLTGNVSATLWSIIAQTGNIRLKPNTGYILSRTFTESGGLRNAGGIRVKIGSSYGGTTTGAYTTFTTDSTGIVQILIYAAYNQQGPNSNIDSTVIFSNLLLEEGSTVTTFAPYSKHTHEINLGKNLFDKSKQVSGGLNDTGGISQPTSTSDKTSDYMPCSPNTSYTLSSPRYYLKIAQYDANKTFIKLDQSGNNIPSLTINTDSNAAYIRISYGNAQQEPNVQFEAGSVASSYAPYFEPIELCKLGSYQDYIWKDGEDWKVHKAIGSYQFDGSEPWVRSGNTTASVFVGRIASTFKSYIDTNTSAGARAVNIMTHFERDNSLGNRAGLFDVYNGGISFDLSFDATKIASATDVATWVATNKPKLYAVLRSATDTTITEQMLIAQLEALVNGGAENGTTYIKVNATDPNLPGLLVVEAPKYE